MAPFKVLCCFYTLGQGQIMPDETHFVWSAATLQTVNHQHLPEVSPLRIRVYG